MKRVKNKPQKVRSAVQAFFLMISVYLFIMLILGRYNPAHAFCPYAPVCFGMMKFGFMGNMLILFPIAILSGLLICILTIFIGRKFCGYVCPFGTVQELIFMLHNKKYKLTKHFPFFYEYKFRRLKYIVLAATTVLTIMGMSFVYMKFCPVMTIAGLTLRFTYPILNIVWQGCLTILVILGMGYLAERFWCRFLCPMAALMNLFQYMGNLLGFKRLIIHRNMESCIDCYLCNKSCPMNLEIQCNEEITDPNCIHCLQCVACCPKKNTLSEMKQL